jgi:predicted transposase YdaD
MEAVERLPFESQKLIWQQLAEKARISALTPQEHELYEESWLNYCTNMNVLETAKEEGLAEGRAEGREEGLAEGLKEGRAEGEARLWDAARNLKSQGVPITVIGQATGLSEEELTQL